MNRTQGDNRNSPEKEEKKAPCSCSVGFSTELPSGCLSQEQGFYYDKDKGRWMQHGVEENRGLLT